MLVHKEIIGWRVASRGTDRRQYGILNHAKREHLLVVEIAVAGQDMLLELFLVRVPELGGLGVQRARTIGSGQ
jgi:hypothetical protein